MRFRKLHGAGNDFILLTGPVTPTRDWPGIARTLCARQTGIGADGLVISTVASTGPAVLDVTCLNADGSTATMCGNALRCAAWTARQEYGFRRMTLHMAGVDHQARVDDTDVWVTAQVNTVTLRRLQAVWRGCPFWFDSAHTGTEHVVAVVQDVEGLDAEAIGRMVRHHPDLAPVGTNVNFVQALGPQEIRIRTYERGVEAETLSCGSGAVASVVIATQRGLVAERPVVVHNRAGTPLTVTPHQERPHTLWVSGPVTHVYEGALA